MLQNPCKTLGFKKNMESTKFQQGEGGGKPYRASGLKKELIRVLINFRWNTFINPRAYPTMKSCHERFTCINPYSGLH